MKASVHRAAGRARARAATAPAPAGAARESSAERILEESIALFAERGYRGTTTRAVASAAGVNVATLAYHFGDKEGLYRAALAQLYRRVLALEPVVELDGGTEERIEQLTRLVFRFMRAHTREIRLLQRHVLEHGLLPSPVRESWSPQLFARAEQLWDALRLPKGPSWRLDLLALSYLFARSAIADAADVAPAVGNADPHGAVEDHLCEVTRRILLGGAVRPRRRAD